MNLKNIHIGNLIQSKVEELQIPMSRIVKFLNCDEYEVEKMYKEEDIDTNVLLRWSKLLEFDFFRIYSGHLILYSPPAKVGMAQKPKVSKLEFRKNVYTKEVKDHIIKEIKTKQITTKEAILKYRIPKPTLFNWIKKE
ncbi:transposase [Chryseobacterium oryctis]|uniref:Transposase n=1 Tax=Chryseobacterium oryctis TaxID=2952618 RepID=A0ABT3HL13_9FLAO|nr:transposase [Chryseobacterium oryctis]MCW3160469.1 transposase [Chryseobacterium oryctis]